MLRHPRARSKRMSSRGQLMGGTFDEVPIEDRPTQYVLRDWNGGS